MNKDIYDLIEEYSNGKYYNITLPKYMINDIVSQNVLHHKETTTKEQIDKIIVDNLQRILIDHQWNEL